MTAENASLNPLLEDALTALPEIAQRLASPLNLTPYPDWQPGWDIASDQRVDASVQACRALVDEWVSQAAARMAVRKPWRLPVVTAPVAEVPLDLHVGETVARLESADREWAEVADRAGAAMAEYAAEVGAEPVTDGPVFPDETYDLEAAPVTQDATEAEIAASLRQGQAEAAAGLTVERPDVMDGAGDEPAVFRDPHALELDPVQAAAMDRFNEAHDAEAGPDGTTVMPAVEAHTEAIAAVTEEGQP